VDEEPGVLERIVRHVLVFPVATMQEATEGLLLNILQRNAEGVKDLFSGLVAGLTLQNPGLKTSTGNPVWAGAEDIFADTWSFTVRIAIALWPATLAITAAAAASDATLTSGWGVVELKRAMADWVGGVLLCAFSLEILDLFNRLSNALIVGIISLPISGATDLSMETVVNVLLGAALKVFAAGISPLAAIIAMGVLLILGLATVIGLIGQYFARMALLYVVVALAPVVLVISILRPARWLRWLWIKGVLLVMLLGPITMLLLKLAIAGSHAIVNPILSFLMVVGVVSMLLAISGAIVKAVFGAAGQVVGEAVGTVKGVAQGAATAVLAVGAGLLGGGAALGLVPAGISGGGGGGAAAASAGPGGLGVALASGGAGGVNRSSMGPGGSRPCET
jgi:hypothetical protein